MKNTHKIKIINYSHLIPNFQDFSRLLSTFPENAEFAFPPRSFNDLINPITKPKKFVSPAPQNMEITSEN